MSQRPRLLWQGAWPLWCHSEVRKKKETLKETKWREAELFFCCFELPAFSFLTPDGTPDRVLHGPPAENQRRCWSYGAPRELCVSLHIFKHQTFVLKMKTDDFLSAAVNLFLFGGLVFPWCTRVKPPDPSHGSQRPYVCDVPSSFYRKCLFIHIEYEWMKVDCFNKTFLRFSDRFTGFCWRQSSSAGLWEIKSRTEEINKNNPQNKINEITC